MSGSNRSGGGDLPRRLSGKVAVVTGGSRGIGFGIAERLVADGARVCLTGRKQDALVEAVDALPPDSAIWIAGKADDADHRTEVLDRVAQWGGGLDILVNNVGINPAYGTLLELELGAARKILEVNVVAALGWVQDVCGHPDLHFAERGGNVVLVSSVAGQTASPGIGMYSVSKAANAHLTRALAVELGPRIRVNAVAPAVVKTAFAKAMYEGRENEVAADYPMRRLGTPEDVAGAVSYLVSDDASWVTGHVLTVDGGLIIAGGTA